MSGSPAPERARLTPEALWEIPRVAPPRGRGRTPVVVGVTRFDEESPTGRTQLHRWDGARGSQPLTSERANASEPAVSPCGRLLAFGRKQESTEPAQLWLLPLDGGEARVLTDTPHGVRDPLWDPRGRGIFFLSEVYRDAPTLDATRAEKEALDALPQPRPHVTSDRLYRFWDRWLTDDRVHHIFYWDRKTESIHDITPNSRGWFDLMDPAGDYDIAPDGTELAFCSQVQPPPYRRIQTGLLRVSLGPSDGPGERLTGHPPVRFDPDHEGEHEKPRYSPDGRFLVYGRRNRWDFYADRVRLIRVDRDSDAVTELALDWDRSPSEWIFSEDGASLLCLAEDEGRTALYRVDLHDAAATPTRILRGGTLRGLAWSEEGEFVAVHDDLRHPPELARLDLEHGRIERVTAFTAAAWSAIETGAVEEITFEGARNEPVQMFLVHPPDYDATRKYPVVHLIHGGPHGIFGDQFHFRWNAHTFANAGYLVTMVNFHGSTSFGQDFAESIHGAWGELPTADYQAATDLLAARKDVDADRIAIAGGSYGGYLTAWLTTQTTRFRAAVCHAGVVDFGVMYGGDITQGWPHALGGVPWGESRESFSRYDPIAHLDAVVTPTLIVHGEKDYRVPVGQGLELYGLLQEKGVDTRLVHYADENHWILKRHNSIHWYGEVLGWLRKHLTP